MKYEFNKEYFNAPMLWISIEPSLFGDTGREDPEIDLRELSSETKEVIIQSEINLSRFPCNDILIISDNKRIDINTSNCRYTISGSHNRINVLYENSITLNGSNNYFQCGSGRYHIEGFGNHIKAHNSAVVDIFRGSRNTVEIFNYSSVKINRGVKGTSVKASDYSTIINEDNNSNIYCFDCSICRTVPRSNVHTFGNKSIALEMTNILGKDACIEPVDENSGYFYKAVRRDMRPLMYNLGKNEKFKYEAGKELICEDFDKTLTVCAAGFHFFATVEEAVHFGMNYGENFLILRLLVNFDDIAETNNGREIAEKFRARKVFVDSIVPEERYKDFLDNFTA